MNIRELQQDKDELERLDVYLRNGDHIVIEETSHVVSIRGYSKERVQKFTHTLLVSSSEEGD